jgi:transcriptional regulator with XRE-family HTH domain
MAAKCEVSLEDYISYESGSKDFSFSFLYNAANALGVDVVDLMSAIRRNCPPAAWLKRRRI